MLEETLRPEVREEVGIDLDDDVTCLRSSSFVADFGEPVVNLVFRCRYRSGEATIGAADEVAAVR